MWGLKYSQIKGRIHTSLILFLLPLFLIACEEIPTLKGGGQTATSGGSATESGLSLPLPKALLSNRTGLDITAKLIVDGGTPIALVVDLVNDRVSGNSGQLSPGTHTFDIEYFLGGILIARTSDTGNIVAGGTIDLVFDPAEIDLDLDKDGVTGIDEISAGTDPNDATSLPQPPNGVIDTPLGDVTINTGESLSFTSTVTDPDSTTFTFLWDFGGGADSANATLEDPGLVVFKTPGIFAVTFTVTDSLSLADPSPSTIIVTVLNQAPNGVINSPTTGLTIVPGQSVNFTATGADPENNTPFTFAWNFGGAAANSSLKDPGLVTFNALGTFTVTFTITDSTGLSDPTPETRIITVKPNQARMG